MKDFETLYNEYKKSLAVQKKVIDHYRKQLLAASKKANASEVKRLNGVLYILYEEKSELEERASEIGGYLKSVNCQKRCNKNI